MNGHQCKIPGCRFSQKNIKKGFCDAHYRRNRLYGSPLGGGVENGAAIQLIEQAVAANRKGCLFWPYRRDNFGYGRVRFKRRATSAHRLALIMHGGPPPSARHQAAHDCGNGHLGCYNPLCLSWLTPQQNMDQQLTHGTRLFGEKNHAAKLTAESIQSIISDQRRHADIAADFGVHRSTISKVKSGRHWSNL